jgi:hypothetical protein
MTKKQRLLCATLLAVGISGVAQAQELKRFNLGVDVGGTTYCTDLRENQAIRATSSATFFDPNGTYELKTSTKRYYYGLKAEFISSNGYIGLSTGLRYTQMKSTLKREDWLEYGKTKFYVLYSQNNSTTEYAQVEEIKQQADYLSIPLDLRLYTMRPRFFRLFVNLGFDFGIKVADKTRIDFINTTMNPYEEQVGRALGTPASFLATFNPGLGFKLGSNSGVNVSMQVNLPSYVISTKASTLATNKLGIGAQLSIYCPIM